MPRSLWQQKCYRHGESSPLTARIFSPTGCVEVIGTTVWRLLAKPQRCGVALDLLPPPVFPTRRHPAGSGRTGAVKAGESSSPQQGLALTAWACAAIGFPKMFRALLCRHGAERFTVSRHENRELSGSMGKMQQRAVDLRLQVDELWKVLQMRGFLLDLLPQVFDRVELRRVGWQLLNGQARRMGVDKLLHGLARMI